MKCSVCNLDNLPGSKFCGRCGAPLQPTPVVKKKAELTKEQQSEKIKAMVFWCLQMVIYLTFIAGNILILFFEKTIKVNVNFEEFDRPNLSLIETLLGLINGSSRVNPTVVSIIMGISAMVLIMGSSTAWLAVLITKIVDKGHKAAHALALIISFISLPYFALLIPLANRFSKVLLPFSAKALNIYETDIESVISIWLFVFVGIYIALIIMELIFALLEQKATEKYKR